MDVIEQQQKFVNFMTERYKEFFAQLRKTCNKNEYDPAELIVKIKLPTYMSGSLISGGRYLGIKVEFE